MQHLLKAIILTAITTGITPAYARAFEFDTTLKTPVNLAIEIDVGVSNELKYCADHLPKKLKDRSNGRLNAAFANNGFYGERDLDSLEDKLEKSLEKAFFKIGLDVADDAEMILKVTILDAKPNRPTLYQLQKDIGLSYQSVALGGAEIQGELLDVDGAIVATMTYKYYANDIQQAQYGGTWSDANRAFMRFANMTAIHLNNVD